MPLQACSTARQTVQVQLVSYNNPDSEDCDGGNCEGVPGGTCDNIFQFCLRAVGSVTCLSTITTVDIENDSFTFTQSDLNELEISNPLVFTSIQRDLTGVSVRERESESERGGGGGGGVWKEKR